MSDTDPRLCSWHSGLKSDIEHLSSSDRDQWDAIAGLRNKLDKQTWLLIATLAGIVTQLILSSLRCIPFILVLLVPFQAQALDWSLTDSEKKAELTFQVLNIADLALTDRIIDQGGYEMNPCLPIDEHTTDLEMVGLTVLIGGIHYLVTAALPHESRPYWQWITVGFKGIAVGHNITVVEW